MTSDRLGPQDECTGRFSDARDCPVHNPLHNPRNKGEIAAHALATAIGGEIDGLRAAVAERDDQIAALTARIGAAIDYLEVAQRPSSVADALSEGPWDRGRRAAIRECLNVLHDEKESKRYVSLVARIDALAATVARVQTLREEIYVERIDIIKQAQKNDRQGEEHHGDELREYARALSQQVVRLDAALKGDP